MKIYLFNQMNSKYLVRISATLLISVLNYKIQDIQNLIFHEFRGNLVNYL